MHKNLPVLALTVREQFAMQYVRTHAQAHVRFGKMYGLVYGPCALRLAEVLLTILDTPTYVGATMLKWFSSSDGPTSQSRSSQVGRTYHVGDHHLIVQDVIAEGGFAVVFQVRTAYGQRYALKRMAVNDEEDLFLCKQEIAITKALSDCRHSVTFIASAINRLNRDVHEVLILLQEYTGGRVVDMMNARLGKGFTEPEVLKVFTDICQAVARLHHRTKPIIHRDLKVENIISDTEGQFVLCDYGSCTVKSMHPEVLGASECEDQISRFTTLAYRAPEMVSLYSGKSITTKADIWALGCLLYKLCFFTTPFGEQPLAIVSGSFTIPDNSRYSEALHSLIHYMLEPDPDCRPTIWQVCEVAFKLRRLRNPVPNVFRSPGPPATLPIAPRVKDSKTPVKSSNDKSSVTPGMSRSNNPQVMTTSISSRERPRASRPPLHRRRSASPDSPSLSSHTHSHHLRPPMTSSLDHSRSLPSGLDEFGSVPFTPGGSNWQQAPPARRPSPLVSSQKDQVGPPPLQTQQEGSSPATGEVRRDLFGSTPFASPQNDVFGAKPFVSCTQNTVAL